MGGRIKRRNVQKSVRKPATSKKVSENPVILERYFRGRISLSKSIDDVASSSSAVEQTSGMKGWGGKRSRKSGASIARCAKGQRVQSGVSDDRGRDRVVVQPGESRPWAIASSSPPGPAARTPATGGASVVQCDTVSDAARRVTIAMYFLEAMDAPPASEDTKTAAWIRK